MRANLFIVPEGQLGCAVGTCRARSLEVACEHSFNLAQAIGMLTWLILFTSFMTSRDQASHK